MNIKDVNLLSVTNFLLSPDRDRVCLYVYIAINIVFVFIYFFMCTESTFMAGPWRGCGSIDQLYKAISSIKLKHACRGFCLNLQRH